MNERTARLEALRKRTAPLAMSAGEFRAIGHQLVDLVAERLAAVPEAPLTRSESPAQVRALLGAARPLPLEGEAAGPLVAETAGQLFDHSLFNGHPRFFGYITSSPAPIGMFGDFLAAAVNQNVGAWGLSPLATEIECQAVRWMAELIGFPQTAGGLFVSGGNMANFVGVLAARAAAAGWDVRAEGLSRQSLVLYGSAETHTWIQKAADLFGFGTDAIRWIPTDARQCMDVAALRSAIEADRRAGLQPFLVVGTAGSVSTGAVDPLDEIAAVCREQSLWFHVDGCYGAVAAEVPGAPASLRALAQADSIAVDPHKWLYAPLEAGCVLVRDPEALRRAFSYHPAYYHFDEQVVNFFELGPQNSRGFRALKVWLALRQVGREGYRRMIADDMLLAGHLHERVSQNAEFEPVTQSLSITTFRYVPVDLRPSIGSDATEAYLDRLNRELLVAIERSGDAFLSSAVVSGRFALRACVVNFHTSLDDIEALLPLVSGLGKEIDAALRREPAVQYVEAGL
ncbi:MAG TPA: aspartate aminotransferase family protein [Vicinamibacterales bacterium]|jgi:glutamate/tyrosine decarboxylase-like PLP-dependent enzyme|nr:aspartate aminotransferase family protein [Vicinamibacterales bacterium]